MPNSRKITSIVLFLLLVNIIVEPIEISTQSGFTYNVKSGDTKSYELTLLEKGKEQTFTVKAIVESVTENGVSMDYTGFEALEKEKNCFEEFFYMSCFFKWIEMDFPAGSQPDKDYQMLRARFLTSTSDKANWTDYSSSDPGYTITELEIRYSSDTFNANTNISHSEEFIFDLKTGWLKSSTEKYEHKMYNKISKFSFVQEEGIASSSTSGLTGSSENSGNVSTTSGWGYGILIFGLVSILLIGMRKEKV